MFRGKRKKPVNAVVEKLTLQQPGGALLLGPVEVGAELQVARDGVNDLSCVDV